PVGFRVWVQLAGEWDEVADSTAVWPERREELEFGTLTLTELVDELALEMRKMIFDPVPRVDGIDPAGDPLTEVRSEIYLRSGRRRRAAAARRPLTTGAPGNRAGLMPVGAGRGRSGKPISSPRLILDGWTWSPRRDADEAVGFGTSHRGRRARAI